MCKLFSTYNNMESEIIMSKFDDRIHLLRKEMEKEAIDCYMVVTDDFHASEYVDDYFKEREWLSGFTGSQGTLIVTQEEAGLWTDGRYFLQAEEELSDSQITLYKDGIKDVMTITEYLKYTLNDHMVLGYDARTVSTHLGEKIKNSLKDLNIKYKTDLDLVDRIWFNRPQFPHKPIWLLDVEFAGKTREEKLAQLRETFDENDVSAVLISSLDDIAWLYNIRGNDVLYTPVAMAYTLVTDIGATLYIALDAVSEEVEDILIASGIRIKDYFSVYEDIKEIYGNPDSPKLMLDKSSVNEALVSSVHNPVFKSNPTSLAKAVKNPVEIKNFRNAHLKDGVALTKLIYQLKKAVESKSIYKETELSIEAKLTDLRRQQEGFLSLSFESIVASNHHGAIVHYQPTPDSDISIEDGFILIDTGAQYMDGTTDVTRTVSIGEISDQMKIHYTAVLMGHLNIANAKFPMGTQGGHLDAFARKPLWDLGLDYNHGTGHGVGYLLNVHEGPNSIRKGSDATGFGAAFEKGMITSNEPGYYWENNYGIRLESLILCIYGSNPGFFEFETLTLAPFDKASIKKEMMTAEQIETLNNYHQKVFELLSPYLEEDEIAWLRAETEAI